MKGTLSSFTDSAWIYRLEDGSTRSAPGVHLQQGARETVGLDGEGNDGLQRRVRPVGAAA